VSEPRQNTKPAPAEEYEEAPAEVSEEVKDVQDEPEAVSVVVEKPKTAKKKVKVVESDFDVLLERTLKSEASNPSSSSAGGVSGGSSKLQQLEVILTRYTE